ncbi:putative C6 transcription factor, partial [Aureobasidium melanogenum]
MAFSYYEYLPSKAAAVIACLIFVIITLLHTWQLFRTRTWFFIPFVIGGLFEVIGYAARAKSASQHPDYTLMPYILQSLFLLLAPTLFAASIYMELGRILDLTQGESRSLIRRKLLTKIFVMGDVLSFLAQSAGGGMLAKGSSSGNKIIIGGLVLQLLFFGFFMVSAVVFHRRMSGNPTTKVMAMPLPWKKHLHALYAGSIMILVRSLYRLIDARGAIDLKRHEALSRIHETHLSTRVKLDSVNQQELPPAPLVIALIKIAKARPSVSLVAFSYKGVAQLEALCQKVYFPLEPPPAGSMTFFYGFLYFIIRDYWSQQDPALREYDAQAIIDLCETRFCAGLESFETLTVPVLPNIQTLLIGAIKAQEECKLSLSWTFLSAAATMCHTLGFHRKSSLAHEDQESADIKRHLFWQLYMLDKNLSLNLGRGSNFPDADIDAEFYTPSTNPAQRPWDLMSLATILFAKLQGQVYDKLYSASAMNSSLEERSRVVDELSSQVNALRNQLLSIDFTGAHYQERLIGMAQAADFVCYSVLTVIYRAQPLTSSTTEISPRCYEAARLGLENHLRCFAQFRNRSVPQQAEYVNCKVRTAHVAGSNNVMDFLKSCCTNLQAVEGYSSIDYLIYNHQDATQGQKSDWDDQDQRNDLLLCLRQRRVLVQSAVQQKKVCVFGGFQAADDYMKELGWQEHQRGRLEAAALTRPNNDAKLVMQNQHIFTMFLAAVEASLSISLAQLCGAIRVGHLTWILPTESDHQLLSLRAQMTNQATLALLPHANNTGLSIASDTDGANVLLAPSGTPAIVASPLNPTHINDNASSYQARREARMRLSRRANHANWKTMAATKLEKASLPHDESWLRVSLRSSTSQDQLECLWPGSLCLEIPSQQLSPSLNRTDSMHWFDSKDPYQNPLDTAESWFLAQEERTNQEQKMRQAEKDKENAANNPPEEAIPDHLSVTSPVYSRSVQDQISVNGIYPTPPDAIPPIICSDPSIPNVIVSDNPIKALPGLPEETQDQEQDQDMEQDGNTSDVDLDTEDYHKENTDDLFGDADEEMFENPGVTDADFSFFDNPGGVASISSITGPSEEMIDAISDPTPKLEAVELQPPPATRVSEGNLLSEQTKTQEVLKETDKEQEKEDPDVKLEDAIEEAASTPPLSPLKIKDRLLPAEQEEKHIPSLRRDSTFLPVVFKGDLSAFDAKYRASGKFDSGFVKQEHGTNRSNSIALPEKPLKARNPYSLSRRRNTVAEAKLTPRNDNESQDESEFETSQDSDSESMSSVEGSLRSLDIRKRKRGSADEGPTPRFLAESQVESDVESVVSDATVMTDPGPMIDQLVAARESQNRATEQQHKFSDNLSIWRMPSKSLPAGQDLSIWPVLDFTADDLVDIAQLVAEQSTFAGASGFDIGETPTVASPIYSTAQDALRQVFEKAQDCDFARVGAMAAHHAEQAIAAAAKVQQRPIPRRSPGNISSVITIPPPAVHVRRAGQGWELQPTAINFWDTLGLEPAHGPKDVAAFALYPDSGVMGEAVADFLQEIRLAYENRKLGKHYIGGETGEHEDGLFAYRSHGEPSIVNILRGLQTACNALGDLLHDADLEDTIIIYMINPFEDEAMIKYLCGCFQAMLITYSSDREDPPPLILQIVPVSRIACPTAMIVPDQAWLNSLAAFIYDRVPIESSNDQTSSWPLNLSPSIHLASPPSRKINFALSERTPKNLLEEAQILHVAYAVNADNSWLSAAWTDNTGAHHHKASYCLSNTDGRIILTEVRDTTLSLARDSPHRIFVARAGVMRDWEKRIWREKPSENWSIALLDVDVSPALQVGANTDGGGVLGMGAFMTPAATPQASTFTSPETGDTKPSTPAGETPTQQQELSSLQQADPDAFLIDNTDETWGVLMPFSCTRSTTLSRPLASGLLLKRGPSDSLSNLPSLAVDLMDVIPPRIPENAVSWLAQRAPETTLKETMTIYNLFNLCLTPIMERPYYIRGGSLGDKICHIQALRGNVQFYFTIKSAVMNTTLLAAEYFQLLDRVLTSDRPDEETCFAPYHLILMHFSPLLERLAPTTSVGNLTLEDFVYAPTYHLDVISGQNGQLGIQGEEICTLAPAYDIASLSIFSAPETWKPLPKTKARDLSLAREEKEMKPLESVQGKINTTTEGEGKYKFFKPRELGREKEFEREVEVLHRIREAGLAGPTHRLPVLEGLVVAGKQEQVVVGILMNFISSPKLGCHLQSPGFKDQIDLHEKWEKQVRSTVTLLHEHGIVWGDVNPCNVAIDEAMNAWVIDFGGRNTVGFVDDDKAETKEGDWQGVERLFRDWLTGGGVSGRN